MGITLRNTASSVNVKERLDFSCAIFTADGRPGRQRAAHPGASGGDGRDGQADHRRQSRACSRAMCSSRTIRIAAARTCRTSRWSRRCLPIDGPGDSAALLHRQPGTSRRDRRHHARLDAAVLQEPGRRRRADSQFQAASTRGQSRFDELRKLLSSGPLSQPRQLDDNLADIAAQIAANQQGAMRPAAAGRAVFAAGRRGLHAAHSGRGRAEDAGGAWPRLPPGRHEFTDHLDDGTPIRVAITIERRIGDDRLHRHRPGVAGNLNANRAIVTAAVMYVLAAA